MVNQNQTAEPIHCFVCGDLCLEGRCGALHGDRPNDNGGSDLYFAPLCQVCFVSALSYLRQERRIMHLFDNEPTAVDTFGLVIEPKDKPRP